MRVQPIRYVADVSAAVRFYTALGLSTGSVSRPGAWVELPGEAGTVALHTAAAAQVGRCELCFESDEALETVVDRLRGAGFEPEPIVDESFGRSVGVRDPDGVRVQVNEHDRELYT